MFGEPFTLLIGWIYLDQMHCVGLLSDERLKKKTFGDVIKGDIWGEAVVGYARNLYRYKRQSTKSLRDIWRALLSVLSEGKSVARGLVTGVCCWSR